MTFDDILAVEDSLQEGSVFLNGISGKPCHSDSYMTVVDFNKLNEWFAKGLFTKEQLLPCIDYWKTNANMQPPLRLVALTLARKLV